MVVMSGDVGSLVWVVWNSGRGVCVECYVVGVAECFGDQFSTVVVSV